MYNARIKYLLLVILFSLGSSVVVHGQITLHQGDYFITSNETDSLKITTVGSTFPTLAPVASALWDLSTVTDSVPVFLNQRVYSTPTNFYDSFTYFQFLGLRYQGNKLESIEATGLYENGRRMKDTSYNIMMLTSVSTDSIFFLPQTITYSTPLKKIAFPATNGSAWVSQYTSDYNYELSYSFFSFHHAAGLTRSYITETDTVTGWGKMRIKDIAGNPSPYWDVLQVRSVIIKRDSFYANGSLLPPSMMTSFGLTQGKTDTTYIQNYYRIGEVTPLAKVEFRDAGFTTPYRATTHVQRLARLTVNNETTVTGIQVYPNPVTGNVMNITTDFVAGVLGYKLIDVAGRLIAENKVIITSNKGQVELPIMLSPGMYFLHCGGQGAAGCTIQLQVNR